MALLYGLRVHRMLFRNLRINQLFGANTDVGKTVVATTLAMASVRDGRRVFYLKPVSTGPLIDADDQYVSLGIMMERIY